MLLQADGGVQAFSKTLQWNVGTILADHYEVLIYDGMHFIKPAFFEIAVCL